MGLSKFIRYLLMCLDFITIGSDQVIVAGGATVATHKKLSTTLIPAVDGQPEEFTIAHGLANEPAVVQIWSDQTSFRSLYVTDIKKDATNIYITTGETVIIQIELIGY